MQTAELRSDRKREAAKHRPHKHLPYNHAHSLDNRGKIRQTAPGKSKVKHVWGKRSTVPPQRRLTQSKFRQRGPARNR